MLLGGLWHGASWTFVCWGGINGIALCVDKLLGRKKRTGILRMINILITFLFISFTWIFFRSESFEVAGSVIKGIFTLQDGIRQPFAWSFIALVILLICTIVADVKSRKSNADIEGFYPILNLNKVIGLTIFFVEIGLIVGLAYTGQNPFVYFQF